MRPFLTVTNSLLLGALVRLTLLAAGAWQDARAPVPYTDVDYKLVWQTKGTLTYAPHNRVLADAGRHVALGASPYLVATYRYSPLFALVVRWADDTVGVAGLGKVLFAACDLVAAALIWAIVAASRHRAAPIWAVRMALIWSVNPVTAIIGTRGSHDSVVVAVVLLALWAARAGHTAKHIFIAGLALGFAVHLKLYPILFVLPMWINVGAAERRLALGAGLAVGFAVPTLAAWWNYGDAYLEAAFFHHVRRRDHRHNFSLYAYWLYLGPDSAMSGALPLLPQALVAVAAAVCFARKDLPFACFVQVAAFVMFNKVCTSQYFLWPLSLLMLVIPHVRMSVRRATILAGSWALAQALWLAAAYGLEFEGRPTFRWIWLSAGLLFALHVVILMELIRARRDVT